MPVTVSEPKVAPEIVDRLEAILTDHWSKGTYGIAGGCCCLVGACGRILGLDAEDHYGAEEAAVAWGLPEVVARLFPERLGAWLNPILQIDPATEAGLVISFNDHSQTKLADVLKVVSELRP